MLLSALVLRVIGRGFFAFPVYIKLLHILSSYFGSVVILFSHIPLLRMPFYFSKIIGRFIMHYLPTLLEILPCLIATSTIHSVQQRQDRGAAHPLSHPRKHAD